jgi:hypothetical protein
MANHHGDQPRKPIEPLVSVVTEGVALGYEALDLVFEGLRESLRLKSGGRLGGSRGRSAQTGAAAIAGGSGRRRAGPRETGRATSGTVLADLADVAAELLNRAGAIAADVASAAAAGVPAEGEGPSVAELVVEAHAGGEGSTEMSVINHGSTALRNITLSAADLLGAGGASVTKSAIAFDPPTLSHVGPGRDHPVEITVSVPTGTSPGIYRGLVQAEPTDICAVLVLHVKEAPAKRSSGRRS